MTADESWPYFLHGGPADGLQVQWRRAPVGAIYRVAVPSPAKPIYTNGVRDLSQTVIQTVDYEVTGPGHMEYRQ